MLGELTPLEQTRAYREIVAKIAADLDNPVTLTLLEVEDWPEPEHAFLRQLIQPGLRLLDAETGLGLERSPWHRA